jgi:hypothetical protein
MSAFRPWLVLPVLALAAACAPDRAVGVDGAASAALAPRASGPSFSGSSHDADDDPHFVTAGSGAPDIANPVVQFWAKRGEDRSGTIYYHSTTSGRDSTPLFFLRVRAKSLWKRPDGSTIAQGDSVLITLTVTDTVDLVVDCQPSGLLFSPDTPARLKMSYGETSDDLNDDGVVNSTDSTLTRALAIWRKETATSPWIRVLNSRNSTGSHEVEADIGGFTGYAIAY